MSLFELMEQQNEVSETDTEAEPLSETEETLSKIPRATPALLPEKEIPAPAPAIQPQSSPLYQRYMKIQAQYPDAVIVRRLGDFYEILGENAVKIAEELDLTLTGRDCGLESRVPMVGFPVHSSDVYISKLIAPLSENEPDDELQTEINAMKAFEPVALAKLYEIFGDELDLQ